MKTKGRYFYYLLTIFVALAVATVSFAEDIQSITRLRKNMAKRLRL